MKPEWCRKAAEKAVFAFETRIQSGEFECLDPEGTEARDALMSEVARALLQAEQRGRRKGMEESAEIAERWNDRQSGRDIANAIRAKLDEVQK